VAAREGFVARAESGTLFLDEVAELSPKAQVKLLRFLEEREYHRLGESAPRRADVRVVSAANVDLRGRVERGLFREDLFYRIVGHCIRLPPLRERGGDVLMLVHHFLRREAGGEPPRLSVDAERAIARFPWPGNVRQLANEVKRLVLNAHGGVVRHSDLAEEIRERGAGGRGALHAARDEFERRFVREALERNGGNRTATAAELQISRQALVAKMRRLGIVAPRDERRGPTPPGPSAPTAPRGPTPLLG
jgi:DNA-binding NtrC family response regulator